MGKSFSQMLDKSDFSKQFRIVQVEQGHQIKRVYNSGIELSYTDKELTMADQYDLNKLEDIPY